MLSGTSPNGSFLFLTLRQAYIQDDEEEWTKLHPVGWTGNF